MNKFKSVVMLSLCCVGSQMVFSMQQQPNAMDASLNQSSVQKMGSSVRLDAIDVALAKGKKGLQLGEKLEGCRLGQVRLDRGTLASIMKKGKEGELKKCFEGNISDLNENEKLDANGQKILQRYETILRELEVFIENFNKEPSKPVQSLQEEKQLQQVAESEKVKAKLLSGELDAVKIQLNDKDIELKNVRGQLIAANNRLESLENVETQLNNKVGQVRKMSDELQKVKGQLNEKDNALQNTEISLDRVTKDFNRVNGELGIAEMETNRLSRELDSFTINYKKLEQQLSDLQQEKAGQFGAGPAENPSIVVTNEAEGEKTAEFGAADIDAVEE